MSLPMDVQASPEMFIKPGEIEIAPAMAQIILNTCNFEGQRRKRQDHITVITAKMRNGTWLPKGQIDFVRCGRKIWLVNGQHRLAAVVQSDVPQVFTVTFHDVESEDKISNVYKKFDTILEKRKVGDLVGAEGIAKRFKISKSTATAGLRGFLWMECNFSMLGMHSDPLKTRDFDRRFAEMEPWWPLIEEIEAEIVMAADGPGREILRRSTIFSVIMATMEDESPKLAKAKEFWIGFGRDDGLRQGDARKTLRNRLANMRANEANHYSMPSALAALAWGHYAAGRNVLVLRPGAEVPIYGTKRVVNNTEPGNK